MRSALFFLVSLATFLVAGSALAASFSPTIDFRDTSVWGNADHEQSFSATQNGVGITLDANPGDAELYWDSKDGIGVRHNYERDEIEADERLQVIFNGETRLTAIYVSDLFIENGYTETGYYRTEEGTWQDWEVFDATLPGTGENGEHKIVFDPGVVVTGLRFKAPGKINGEGHEFSLLGLDAEVYVPVAATIPTSSSPVPEPSGFMLFCVGGLTVAAARRRRAA